MNCPKCGSKLDTGYNCTKCDYRYCKIEDAKHAPQESHIQDFTGTFNVKGIPITATIKIRVCNECGAEVWDEQLEKANEKIVYKKYNELKGGEIK